MRELIEHIQRDNEPINEVSWRQVAGGAAIAGALVAGDPSIAHAQIHHKHHAASVHHYSDNDYIDAIVGEASNGGYSGMLDIACALRNRIKDRHFSRNPLHQVYGYHAKHNRGESPETWELARKAWAESATEDTVGGATNWGNASDIEGFKQQEWFRDAQITTTRNGHTFFKKREV